MQGVYIVTDSQVYVFIAVQVHIKMPLGTNVWLGPGDIVLHGNPVPPIRGTAAHPNFRPCLFCKNDRPSQLL